MRVRLADLNLNWIIQSAAVPQPRAKADCPNCLATAGRPTFFIHYAYLSKSESHLKQPYIGLTRDLRKRLKDHNEGRSPPTKKFRPWILVAYFAFAEERIAVASEIGIWPSIHKAALPLHTLSALTLNVGCFLLAIRRKEGPTFNVRRKVFGKT